MLKFIKHWISTLMVLVSSSSQREIIVGRYNILMGELGQVRKLSELLIIKKRIRAFDATIKEMGSPEWATNYTRYLEARWNRRYRLWKLQD